MKILVTGGTGLVGEEVCAELFKDGHELIILTRSPEKAESNMRFSAKFVFWDALSDDPPETDDLSEVEAVLNLAGDPLVEGRWTEKKKEKIFESRGPATRRLIQTLKDSGAKLKVFVSASAMGIYGSREDEKLTEDSSLGSDFLSEVCKAWEEPVESDALEISDREVRLRISLVLSADGGFLGEVLPIFKLGLGGPLANGKQWMSWIHIRDLVQIIVKSLEDDDFSGALNCSAPDAVRNSELTKTLGDVLNRPAVIPVPNFGLKLAFGEKAHMLTGSQRLVPEKLQNQDFEFQFTDLKKALESTTHC